MIIKDGDRRHGELIGKIQALEQKLNKLELGPASEPHPYQLSDNLATNHYQDVLNNQAGPPTAGPNARNLIYQSAYERHRSMVLPSTAPDAKNSFERDRPTRERSKENQVHFDHQPLHPPATDKQTQQELHDLKV